MAYKLKISRTAREELERIVCHIVEQLCNPKAASDFLDLLEEKYKFISENPYMYPLSQDLRLRRKGYHLATAKKFLVLYRIIEEQKQVNVGGIFYEGENYRKKLLSSSEE